MFEFEASYIVHRGVVVYVQYVKDIEPEAFDEAVRKHKGPVIVEVYQPGCPACRALLYRLRAVGLLTRQHMPEVKVVAIVRTAEMFINHALFECTLVL